MAAIIDAKCASCGKNHVLCLLNADLFDAKSEYQFVCPATQETVYIPTPDQWAKVVQSRPNDSVAVRPVS